MRKYLQILLFILMFKNGVKAQNCECITLDSTQSNLYLNGNNLTLIDNALRCFKLNSIAEEQDSIIRIWVLESDFPDSPNVWRVKMFEFGKKRDVPFATLNILEWQFKNENSLPVKCIKYQKESPNYGWIKFEKHLRLLDLTQLYKKPYTDHTITNDFGMVMIQFLFGSNTYSVDCTTSIDVFNPANELQLINSKRIIYLFSEIEKQFSISLSTDSKGHDFLKESMQHLNISMKK